jgi:hypothetical protein
MEPEKILHELTYADGLPREALKAASAQRVEMLPLFLDEIETYHALEPARSGETDAVVLHFSSARGVARESRL